MIYLENITSKPIKYCTFHTRYTQFPTIFNVCWKWFDGKTLNCTSRIYHKFLKYNIYFEIFSICRATWKTVTSSNILPTTIIPHGSPSTNPAFTEMAGCPVTLKGWRFFDMPPVKFITSVKMKKKLGSQTRDCLCSFIIWRKIKRYWSLADICLKCVNFELEGCHFLKYPKCEKYYLNANNLYNGYKQYAKFF